MIWISPKPEHQERFGTLDLDDFLALEGEVYRAPSGSQRQTLRIERDGRGYFLKRHWGVGWPEILKNLLTLKLPVLGASNEWRAIQHLDRLGVPTMSLVAYGQDGGNPAKRRSFVLTEELTDTISLEDFCADWPSQPPAIIAKRQLIRAVAKTTRAMHAGGMNHRDLYICHFLLRLPWDAEQAPPELRLIDLHRAQIRRLLPRRWRIRDLGALRFSSLGIGLTQRDLLRFARAYAERPLRETLSRDAGLWRAVLKRGEVMRRRKRKY